mgnify:CR=1 FL=1
MSSAQYSRVGLSVDALRSEQSLRRHTWVSLLLYLASAVATVLWALLGPGHVSALRGRSHGAANYYARPGLGRGGVAHDACFLIVQSAEPFNFVSHAHIDAVEAMASALEALGLVVSVDSYVGGSWATSCAGARHTVLVGWPHLASYSPAAAQRLPPTTVLWNFERVEEGSEWFRARGPVTGTESDGDANNPQPEAVALFRAALSSGAGEVWESSAANVAPLVELLARGDSDVAVIRDAVRHVPVGWVQGMTCGGGARGDRSARPGVGAVPDGAGMGAGVSLVDIVMIGQPSTRRRSVIEQLNHLGLAVTVLEDVFGAERDAVVQRTAVVLNVHRRAPREVSHALIAAPRGTSDSSCGSCDTASGAALLSLREVERILPMLAKGAFILSEDNDRGNNTAGLAWSTFEDIARQALAWSNAGRAAERRVIAARGQLLAVEQTTLYEHPFVLDVVRRWRVARSAGDGAQVHYTAPLTCASEVATARSVVEAWDASGVAAEQQNTVWTAPPQSVALDESSTSAAAVLSSAPRASAALPFASDTAAAASPIATVAGAEPISVDRPLVEASTAAAAPLAAIERAAASWDIAPEHALKLTASSSGGQPPSEESRKGP